MAVTGVLSDMANANIFQQFLKEPPSAMDYADRFAARDASRQQNALNQLVIGEKVRGIEDQNRLRQLYSQNPNLTADELRRQGFRDEAAKVDSAALEKRKTESEIGYKTAQTSKAEAETQAKAADIAYEKAQRHAQGIGSVNTPEDIVAYIDAGIQNGVPGFTVENRQKFIDNANSAGSVEEWKKKAIAGSIPVVERFKADADMKRAQLQSDTQIKTTGMNNATQIKTTGMNNAVSIRGQNLTDARLRDANDISRENKKAEKQEKADVRKKEEDEKSIKKYADTLQKEGVPELETAVSGAEAVLNKYKKGSVPGVGALKGALPPQLMSDEGKDVRQAIAQVRNIVLSARSGAAVTDQELRRLVEELGTGAGMTEDDMRRGLKRVRDRVESIKQNAAAGVSDDVKSEYEARGGIKVKRGGSKPPATGGRDKLFSDADEILKGGR